MLRKLVTTKRCKSSQKSFPWAQIVLFGGLLVACESGSTALTKPSAPQTKSTIIVTSRVSPAETHLGVKDKGIFSDLDKDLQIQLPTKLQHADMWAQYDPDNSLLVSKVSGVNLCGPMMPTAGTISGPAIEKIRKWIEAGAQR